MFQQGKFFAYSVLTGHVSESYNRTDNKCLVCVSVRGCSPVVPGLNCSAPSRTEIPGGTCLCPESNNYGRSSTSAEIFYRRMKLIKNIFHDFKIFANLLKRTNRCWLDVRALRFPCTNWVIMCEYNFQRETTHRILSWSWADALSMG